MQNVVNSLAVLSFLGTVLLLFAFAALLRMVRDLQQAAAKGPAPAGTTPATRSVPRFASGDERPTFVLVVTETCPMCRERASRLMEVSGAAAGHLVLLSAAERCAEWVEGEAVTAIVDATLLGTIAVGATPTLIKYSPSGEEQWRRVVGSNADLDAFLEAAPVTADERVIIR
ncbi:hypothetical protein AB0B45_14585 [Nonomuraea sp. NPDC049152]|uniref:hypothetical protein n=1 Tax=Nonomuraea sp. NPDC049152 TaxID=3154350 RepID=UPI0033FFE5E2